MVKKSDIQKEMEQTYKQAYEDASADALALLFSIALMVAKKNYHFGPTRLHKLAEDLLTEWQAFEDDDNKTLKQYTDEVFEATGYRFTAERED